MKKNVSCIPGLIFVAVIWFALSVWCFVKPADATSYSERRLLAQFPEVSAENILTGKFMTEFETYSLDQFPLRDEFRTLKAVSAFYLFGKKDNNDIYISDGYAAKIEYPLNENSVNKAADKLTSLYNKYIEGTDAKVYLSVIPDKGFYLAEPSGYPAMDYEKLISVMKEKMDFADYIDVTDKLSITDYYKTDTHWRQEKILDVAEEITSAMGTGAFDSFEEVKTDVPFYGVYYGQSALPLPSESISYVHNEVMDNCEVYNAETGKTTIGMIDYGKMNSRDPYEMFLSGATPILKITNPAGVKGKELVVFRDSFGSSLVPLLVADYETVTVVDTRYIVPDYVGNFVNFEGADDVLFVYSTVILNQSEALR